MLSLTFSQSSVAESKTVRKSIESEFVTVSPAKLEIEGRYGNIVALMNKLQDGSRLVRISSVSINSDKKNPGYLECDMAITIYVTNEKEVF